MGRQIWWILRSYLSNKMFLAVLAGLALWGLFVGADALTNTVPNKSNIPAPPRGSLVVSSKESLEYVRRERLEAQVDDIDLGNVWIYQEMARQDAAGHTPGTNYSVDSPPASFYEILDEFPNLRNVRLSNVQSAGLQHLAGRRGIKYLQVADLGPHGMAAIAQLPDLERLDLQEHMPVQGIDQLVNLPRLEMLVLGNLATVNDAVLADIARLPHLRVFGVRSTYFSHEEIISDDGLRQLASAPSLKTIYVGGPRLPKHFDILVRAREVLPSIDVEPAMVPRRYPWVAGYFPAVAAVGIGIVVASQLSSPASRLAPGFLLAHAITAGGWLCGILLAMLLFMVSVRQPVVQSLILCSAAAMFFFAAGVDSVSKRRLGPAARATLWDWIVGLGVPLAILAGVLPDAREYALQWRLLVVLVAGVFLLVAMWHIVAILYRLPVVQAVDRPLPQYDGFLQVNRVSLLARRERLIERWSEGAANWTSWRSLQRLRAGNPPLNVIPFVAMFLVGALPVFITLRRVRPGAGLDPGPFFVFLPLIMLLMICGQVALKWRQRLTCLDVESLRPMSRSVVQRDWAIAMLLDLLPSAAIVGLVVGVASQVDLNAMELGNWLRVLPAWPNLLGAFVFLTAVLWMITAAACSLLVVIERQWMRLALTVLLLLMNSVGMGFLLAFRPGGPPRNLTAWDVLPTLWLPLVTGALVLAGMWHRWVRIDFDRRS